MEDIFVRLFEQTIKNPDLGLIDIAALLFILQSGWSFYARKRQSNNGGTIETKVLVELRKNSSWNRRIFRVLKSEIEIHHQNSDALRTLAAAAQRNNEIAGALVDRIDRERDRRTP